MPTNIERAASARAAITAMNKHRGDPNNEVDLQDDITDLITNLLHLAHQEQLDPQGRIDCALTNFDDEHCAAPGCAEDNDDGEGFDGYCGNCADKREARR